MIFSKYLIVNASLFFAAMIFLLLSPFSIVINFLALLCFGVAFLMLAYSLHKNYKKIKTTVSVKEEELILEMATEEGGEDYVYKKSKVIKNQNKEFKTFLRDRLTSIIASYVIGFAFIYFCIRLII